MWKGGIVVHSLNRECVTGCLRVLLFCFFVVVVLFCFNFRAVARAYGDSETRGQFRDAAEGLNHSHSNTASEPHL